MKPRFKFISLPALVVFLTTSFALTSMAQPAKAPKPNVDAHIIAGLNAVKEKRWAEARVYFEEARKVFEKEKLESDFLFTKIRLADEDPEDLSDPQTAPIVIWRHTMGTKQAITAFIAFSSQLEGSASAAKNFSAIYNLQSLVWGTSWRAFNPPIVKLFYETAPPEKTDNYASFLHQAGNLLWSSEDESASEFFEKAQQISPKEWSIAASLASWYLFHDNAAGAKKQAELSLSLKPNNGRVLIDLATIEWVLGELDLSAKHAGEAALLLPDLPGPHVTLALIALEKGDHPAALKEAEIGVKLSNGHTFYKTIMAAALKANGKEAQARALLTEVWGSAKPDTEMLKKQGFLKGKPLEYIVALSK